MNATVTAKKKTRKQPATFRITFTIGEDAYNVRPLDADPAVARVAFRFAKLTGDRTTSDVHIDPEGHPGCTCPGWTYRQKPCRHLRTLAAARMIPASVLVPHTR